MISKNPYKLVLQYNNCTEIFFVFYKFFSLKVFLGSILQVHLDSELTATVTRITEICEPTHWCNHGYRDHGTGLYFHQKKGYHQRRRLCCWLCLHPMAMNRNNHQKSKTLQPSFFVTVLLCENEARSHHWSKLMPPWSQCFCSLPALCHILFGTGFGSLSSTSLPRWILWSVSAAPVRVSTVTALLL